MAHLPVVLGVWGEPASRSGLAFTAFAAVALIAMASPVNRMSDRYGRLGPVVAGLDFVGAGMLVLGTSGDVAGALFYAVYSLGVVIGSVFSGLLAEWLGESSGMPFLMGMAVALAAIPAILISWRLSHRTDRWS